MECQGCRFWMRKPHSYGLGFCHRHAPVPVFQSQGAGAGVVTSEWPAVTEIDWCGDWERMFDDSPSPPATEPA